MLVHFRILYITNIRAKSRGNCKKKKVTFMALRYSFLIKLRFYSSLGAVNFISICLYTFAPGKSDHQLSASVLVLCNKTLCEIPVTNSRHLQPSDH